MLQQAEQWKTNVAQAQGNLIFGQPFETRLRFPDGCRIANIDSLDDDGYRVPDGAGFCSGPGDRLNRPVYLEEIPMAVSREHRMNDGKIRGRITEMNIAPVDHTSKFMRVFANQELTSMQIAVDKRAARRLFDRRQGVEQIPETSFKAPGYHALRDAVQPINGRGFMTCGI